MRLLVKTSVLGGNALSSLRKLGACAAVAVVSASLMVGVSGVASASAADCAHGANGFVDIPDDLEGTVVANSPGRSLTVEVGIVGGVKRGWARAHGSEAALGPGDSVWMDWSQDGGNTWLQCGPFGTSSYVWSLTSAAKATNPSPNWRFRGGAYFNGVMSLTPWY